MIINTSSRNLRNGVQFGRVEQVQPDKGRHRDVFLLMFFQYGMRVINRTQVLRLYILFVDKLSTVNYRDISFYDRL